PKLLFRLRRGGRAGLAQLHGGEEPGGRRHDRRDVAGERTRRVRLGGARPRPRVDIRLLRSAAVPYPGPIDRPLDPDGTPGEHLAVRLVARNLVASTVRSMTQSP